MRRLESGDGVNRGIGFVLILGVILMGFSTTYLVDRYAVAYLPPELSKTWWTCKWPSQQVERKQTISDFEADWYPAYWRAAREPSLYAAARGSGGRLATTYRFTWLPSFDPPVFVRVDEDADGAMRLTATQLKGYGGYGAGAPDRQVSRILSPDETGRIRTALASTRVFAEPQIGCDHLTDGAMWIVEANQGGQYHYVNRHSPLDGPVRELGLAFLGLTGWTFARIY